MDLGSALMALLISMVVKVAVLVFGARLLLRLYRARGGHQTGKLWILLPKDSASEVRLLWWALVLFYLSELTCGIEVYVIFRSNPYLSSFHAFASAAGMGLFAVAVTRLINQKVLHYGEKNCAMKPLCRGCTIKDEPGCRLNLLFTLLATFVALAALYPFAASTARLVADTSAYELPFASLNTWYDNTVVPWLMTNVEAYEPSGQAYYIPQSVLFVEFRVIPGIAFVLAVVSIVLLQKRRGRVGAEWLALSAGVLAYPYFELILLKTTQDLILGSLGHEIAEFWFLVVTAELLRVSFGPRTQAAASGKEQEQLGQLSPGPVSAGAALTE